jgi:hypothetical protein
MNLEKGRTSMVKDIDVEKNLVDIRREVSFGSCWSSSLCSGLDEGKNESRARPLYIYGFCERPRRSGCFFAVELSKQLFK